MQSDVVASNNDLHTHLHETWYGAPSLGTDANTPDLLPAVFGLFQESFDSICHVSPLLNDCTKVVYAECYRLSHQLFSLDTKQSWV